MSQASTVGMSLEPTKESSDEEPDPEAVARSLFIYFNGKTMKFRFLQGNNDQTI